MRKSTALSLLAMASAMSAGLHEGPQPTFGTKGEPETEEDRRDRLKVAEANRNKAKGLTQYFYGENSLWALNQKSADKKAKKKGFIK